jgi:hypothetical protein
VEGAPGDQVLERLADVPADNGTLTRTNPQGACFPQGWCSEAIERGDSRARGGTGRALDRSNGLESGNCLGGNCTCPPLITNCNGTCTNTNTDPNHCRKDLACLR